jgi:DNA-binding GntR family transcriptional regulator
MSRNSMLAPARRRGARKKPGSLTEIAYRAVKDEILANRLRPGEPLPHERLIRELGLSRTPLREAVLQLAKVGTFVSHLDLHEIQDMYQVRRTLEGLAAREAAGFIDEQRLAAVEKELRRHPVAGDVDLAAISEAGQQVHRLIVESCPNRVLARFIQSLQDHFRRFRSLSLAIREKVLSSHQEHLAILDALKRSDGDEAQRLVHEHFDHAARYLLESLLTRSRSSEEAKITVPAAAVNFGSFR